MAEAERDAHVRAIAQDWRTAPLTAADQALCVFANKLTREVRTMHQDDVGALRAVGFDDVAIHDAAQVVSYFNYINRMAEALGVELETFVHAWEAPSA